MTERTNPITPAGFAALRAEYERLFAVERPAVVEIVSWAAAMATAAKMATIFTVDRNCVPSIGNSAGFPAR